MDQPTSRERPKRADARVEKVDVVNIVHGTIEGLLEAPALP